MNKEHCLPDIVTHNYDPQRGAFRNVCDLPRAKADRILDEIRQSGQVDLKSNYLERRLRTERWLRETRQRVIGSTSRNTPIYFFVGDFDDAKDPWRSQSVQIPLSHFSENIVTFTYSDSMSCFEDRDASDCHFPPFYRRLFTLTELKKTVQKHGMPKGGPKESSARKPFIEMQLWDETPLTNLIK